MSALIVAPIGFFFHHSKFSLQNTNKRKIQISRSVSRSKRSNHPRPSICVEVSCDQFQPSTVPKSSDALHSPNKFPTSSIVQIHRLSIAYDHRSVPGYYPVDSLSVKDSLPEFLSEPPSHSTCHKQSPLSIHRKPVPPARSTIIPPIIQRPTEWAPNERPVRPVYRHHSKSKRCEEAEESETRNQRMRRPPY